MNKLMKKIVTVALALTMVMGTVLSVSATTSIGEPGHQGAAGTITKVLEVPSGVATPAKTFEFTFVKDGIRDAAGVPQTDAVQPSITPKNIGFVAGFTQTPSGIVGYNKSTNTNNAILTGITWPHAGEYVYTISETTPTSPADPSIRFSQATYEMTVYVENVDLDVDNSVAVTNVVFRKKTNDDGTAVTKVTEDSEQKFPKADPIFTNRYKVLTKLDISKRVKGDFADTQKYFTFTPTFTRPVDSDEVISVGTVVNSATGVAVSPARTVTVTFATGNAIGTIVTVPAGGTFTLKHGETLKFEGVDSNDGDTFGKGNLPAGTVWTVEETATAGYTPSAVVNNNNDAPTTAQTGTKGASLAITTDGTNPLVAGTAGANAAAFTNEYQTITPTGILLNNLPFILLIVVAIGGFVGYIASKRRKASN